MKTLLSIFLLLLSWPVAAQETVAYKITINSRGMGEKYNYEIALLRSHTSNLVIVKKEKPESPVFSPEDSLRALALLEDIERAGKDELIQLAEKNRKYATDTLALRNDHPIFQVTDAFFRNRKRIKQHADEDKRIVLDGFTVKLTLDDHRDEVEVIYARSPTQESHPEIYRLISQILQTYSREAQSPILQKGI